MTTYCSICLKKETLSDFAEGTTFTHVEDKSYCIKCIDDIEYSLIFCDRCYKWEHRNENFDKNFVKTKDINNDVIYYHIKCLFDYELCPICKTYLKNKECIDIFIDYNLKIEYHKSCFENNIFKCDYCGISLRVNCEHCERIFCDCYNKECKKYGYNIYYEKGYNKKAMYNEQCDFCNRLIIL